MTGSKENTPPGLSAIDGGGHEDADLAQVSRVYSAAESDEPSPALDNVIRAAARRAVHARPQPVRKSGIRTWTGPVAVAAVLVLSVSVGLLTVEEIPEIAPPPMQQAMKPRMAVPGELQEGMLDEASRPSVLAKADEKASGISAEGGAASSLSSATGATARTRKKIQPAPAPEPVPFSAEPEAKQEASAAARVAQPNADATRLPDVPASMGSGAAEANARLSAPSRLESRSQMKLAEAEPPKGWIERILQLRKEGKIKEAEEELSKFMRRYPDYPLPEELRTVKE